ncbi:hypothetical protein [Oleiharenicola lentus]
MTDFNWKGIVFMTVLLGVTTYFIAGAIWQQNESAFSKHVSGA